MLDMKNRVLRYIIIIEIKKVNKKKDVYGNHQLMVTFKNSYFKLKVFINYYLLESLMSFFVY